MKLANHQHRWLGIDFSGDVRRWTAGTARSNVWLADVRLGDGGLLLNDLRTVQRLAGEAPPFLRLQRLLSAEPYAAAAIDAPFSVPAAWVPVDGHGELLARVDKFARNGRDFCRACDFVRGVAHTRELHTRLQRERKPYRATDELWRKCRGHRLNVRSTLWCRARGGAAMTAASLTLLSPLRHRLWPWQTGGAGLIVEAFPMAQLCIWDLPWTGYNGSSEDASNQRGKIVDAVVERIELHNHEAAVRGNADALDAVLCAFAAIAVTSGCLQVPPRPAAALEGWIAVHTA